MVSAAPWELHAAALSLLEQTAQLVPLRFSPLSYGQPNCSCHCQGIPSQEPLSPPIHSVGVHCFLACMCIPTTAPVLPHTDPQHGIPPHAPLQQWRSSVGLGSTSIVLHCPRPTRCRARDMLQLQSHQPRMAGHHPDPPLPVAQSGH